MVVRYSVAVALCDETHAAYKCAAAPNPALALWLPAWPLAGRVAILGR